MHCCSTAAADSVFVCVGLWTAGLYFGLQASPLGCNPLSACRRAAGCGRLQQGAVLQRTLSLCVLDLDCRPVLWTTRLYFGLQAFTLACRPLLWVATICLPAGAAVGSTKVPAGCSMVQQGACRVQSCSSDRSLCMCFCQDCRQV